MTTIEKVKSILPSLVYDVKDKSYTYQYRYMCDKFENDEDFELIKEKMTNLVNKLNSLTKRESNRFIKRDFESDIWNDI